MRGDTGVPESGGGIGRRGILAAGLFGGSALALVGRPAFAQGKGGELTVGALGDILSFDGYQYADRNYVIQRLFYDHLVDYDYQLTAKPAGLRSWTMAPDHQTAALEMQPNIMLHGGRAWKVSDLIQSLERASNPKEGWQLLGPMAVVKSWKATGDNHVELTFNEAVSDSVLTDLLSTMPVVDGDKNSTAQLIGAPAGGGPFRLVSRSPNDEIVLEKFAKYWRSGEPYLDRITIKIFDNQDSMVSALESSAIQMISVFKPDDAARLKTSFDISEGYEGALGDVIRFNPLRPPYDNVRLRQAIRRATDRERIAREVYAGHATPSYTAWVTGSVGYDPSYKAKDDYNLAEATRLWKEAGSPPSGTIMADPGVPAPLKAIQIIQSDLRKIGFDWQIDTVDAATFARRGIGGDFGVFYANIGNIGKRSPSAVTTNSFMRVANNVVWKDKLPQSYVDAMRKVRMATTPDAEKAACAELNAVIEEYCWFVPVVLKRTLTAMDKEITGAWRDIDDRIDLRLTKVSA